jgi:hypothetical protein
MGIHFHSKEQALRIQLLKSPWRPAELIEIKKGGKFSFFQNEEADVTTSDGTRIHVEHTVNSAKVEGLPKPLTMGGLDGSKRSIQKFLNLKRTTFRGIDISLSPVESDTWHITNDEQ